MFEWTRAKIRGIVPRVWTARGSVKNAKAAEDSLIAYLEAYPVMNSMVAGPPENVDPDVLAGLVTQYVEGAGDVVALLTQIQKKALALEVNLVAILERLAESFDEMTRSVDPEIALALWPEISRIRDQATNMFNVLRLHRQMGYDVYAGHQTLRESDPRSDRQLMNFILTNARRERWTAGDTRRVGNDIADTILDMIPRSKKGIQNVRSMIHRVQSLLGKLENDMNREITAINREIVDSTVLIRRITTRSNSLSFRLTALVQAGLAPEVKGDFDAHWKELKDMVDYSEIFISKLDRTSIRKVDNVRVRLSQDYQRLEYAQARAASRPARRAAA